MEGKKWYSRKEIVEMRNRYSNGIDKYTDYIESYQQKEAADNNNKRLMKLINFCDEVIRQIDETTDLLKESRIVADVEYSKGYLRIERDKYYYKKITI